MDSEPVGLDEMLRRALKAQVDLGLSEVILEPPGELLDVRRNAIGGPGGLDDENVSVQPAVDKDLFGETVSDTIGQAQYSSLEEHYRDICDCTKCRLSESRNKLVYGTGNPQADLLFIGEGPGQREDELGEPFVGRAGQLLDKILAAIDFSREDVYIANMVKCRPPGNRDPQPDEMETCRPYLDEQIALIRPKLICALGRVAGQALLDTKTPLGKLRGSFHDVKGIPVLVTYHPAALLRFPNYKRPTWEDMQMLRGRYDELAG